jgi:hypothetical protein
VPASTIRRVRVFHGWDVPTMAATFKVSERTVFRWERLGVNPQTLPLDRNAHPASGPEWRRKLLIFLLERLEAARVTDNRPKEATCTTSMATSATDSSQSSSPARS